MSNDLQIQAFVLGDWQTNCYLVWREGLPGCWIVDAGFEPAALLHAVEERDLEPRMLLLTHAHVDH
ncbi:MAG: MBL fold metallo-hydrolase, partial [Planctomycetota bacterium]